MYRLPKKQEILEELDVRRRLEKATVTLNREIQTHFSSATRSNPKSRMRFSKTQREYFCWEQLKAIRKELGDDEGSLELQELEEKIARSKMTDEARKIAEKELDRLKKIPAASPEYTVSRTYLDWLVDLPWGVYTNDNVDIKAAQRILDEDHYGLEKIKDRIIEYLAIRKLKQEKRPGCQRQRPDSLFRRPARSGKRPRWANRSARAMGRKFVRISLGGVTRRSRDSRSPPHLYRRTAGTDFAKPA
jgi:ATP-dependent Lon protease